MRNTLRLRMWLMAIVMCLQVTVSVSAQRESPYSAQDPTSERVVIFSFGNISGASDDAWVGNGIVETLATEFEGLGEFVVIEKKLVFETMRRVKEKSTRSSEHELTLEVGRRLDARWIMSGGYQRLGNQLRITGRLVDVATQKVAWVAKIDGDIDDLFALQDRLAVELVNGTGREPVRASGTPAPRRERLTPFVDTAAPAAEASFSEISLSGMTLSDSPPPPLPPATISRDDQGRATVRAVRLTSEFHLDGHLNEEFYSAVLPITGFIQLLPDFGEPPTEATHAWVTYDENNIYVSARCYDSAPPDRWSANEMRRDTNQLRQNDSFGVMFDTFHDRRNGVVFYTNPLGGLGETEIADERTPNVDWNPVWDVRTGRFEEGWTVEMRIPFKSLRYRPGKVQVWGIQFRRSVARKNEWTYLTRVPASAARRSGMSGIQRISAGGTLVGVEVPARGKNIEIKPYGISTLATDLVSPVPLRNKFDGTVGFDVKYGLTRNLTADFTYNTDFAQVEVDEQQVNLTRFSLFFPEKREFFLEGQGIFGFGGQGSGRFSGASMTPVIFFSRRIGLDGGQVMPIMAGSRVTGKVGKFSVGGLSIQTEKNADSEVASTNFSVVRIQRDLLRRSSIGAIFTSRSVSVIGDGLNMAYGVDASFRLRDNFNIDGYYAQTRTPGLEGNDTSYKARFSYESDLVGIQAEHLLVGDNFNPEIGFIRRDDIRHTFASGRFSPRPTSIDWIRKFTWEGNVDYTLAASTGTVETREVQGSFETEFENSDVLDVVLTKSYEFLDRSFNIHEGVVIPLGGYRFRDAKVSYEIGPSRRMYGTISLQRGEFYNGDITVFSFSRGRTAVTSKLSLEPSISFNWVELPAGSFATKLIQSRVNYTFTPRMFFGGLLQYNSDSDAISSNLRFRWEYQPGSELFLVYTEDRDIEASGFSRLRNRGVVVKVTRLFRY